MKRTLLKTICSSALAISLLASASLPAFADTTNTSTAPYVESDTTVNFTLESNKTYAYKLTVHGSHSNPKIAAGNGKVLRTESTVHKVENGNDVYYFKVRAIGKDGEATGVYTTLPGQNAVRHSDIAIPYVYQTKTDITIGKDIPAGEYALNALNNQRGYYYILDSNNNIQNGKGNYFYNRSYVNFTIGQKIQIGCANVVPLKDVGKQLIKQGNDYVFAPSGKNMGMSTLLKVGLDIPAGKYKFTGLRTEGADAEWYMIIYYKSLSDYNNNISYDHYMTGMIEENNGEVLAKNGEYLEVADVKLSPII